jgi:hypothetical protein
MTINDQFVYVASKIFSCLRASFVTSPFTMQSLMIGFGITPLALAGEAKSVSMFWDGVCHGNH